MMKLKAGRPKGALNIKNKFLAEDLKTLGIDPMTGLKKCLEILNGIAPRHVGDELQIVKIRIDLFSNLLPYLYSKLNPVDPKGPNPWDAMNAEQKLDAIKQYQVLLEKEANGSRAS